MIPRPPSFPLFPYTTLFRSRTLFHVLVGCGLLMLKVSRLKLPVIWLLVSTGHNQDRKSGSAGMPRPNSYAVFCLKKKSKCAKSGGDTSGNNHPQGEVEI